MNATAKESHPERPRRASTAVNTRNRPSFPQKLTFSVTTNHIWNGTRNSCCCCPVALAVHQATDYKFRVHVEADTITLLQEDGWCCMYPVSMKTHAFIRAFDANKMVGVFDDTLHAHWCGEHMSAAAS